MWSFIGLALNLLGNGLMIRVRGPNNSVVELVATQVLVGLGQGIMTCATQVGVQAAVAHQDVGIVTAIYLTVTSIGFAIGAAVAGALWGDILPNQLSKALPDLPAANITLIAGDIAAAKPFLAALPPDAAARMTDAYVHTLRTLNIVSCVMLVPIFVSIFIMKNIKLTDGMFVALSFLNAVSGMTYDFLVIQRCQPKKPKPLPWPTLKDGENRDFYNTRSVS